MKKFTITFLLGSFAYFALGFLIFQVALGSFFQSTTTQLAGFLKSEEETSMLWIFFSCAAYALLATVVLGQWLNEKSPLEGAKKGATIGVLVACMTDFYWFATSHYYNDFTPVIADIAAAGVAVGGLGAVVAWAWGRFE